MKGLLTVLCVITAVALIFPLLIAGVYYRDKNVQPTFDLTEGNTSDSNGEAAEDTEAKNENIIYYYDGDEEKMLSPHIQSMLNRVPNEIDAAEKPAEDTDSVMTETTIVEKEESAVTTAPETTGAQTTKPAEDKPIEDTTPTGGDSIKLRVYIHRSKTYKTLTLAEYVTGVIIAEMPSYFPLEAFKAQAVACRTYTLYKIINDASYHASAHGSTGADVCSNSGHCQTYSSYDDCVKKWGASTAKSIWAKVSQAVAETDSQVLFYNNSPILAVYHSCSYKRTESASNTWGDRPYLVSVTTPESSLDAVYSTVKISSSKFKSYLKSQNSSANFSSDPSTWLGSVSYNVSGCVNTYTIGGVKFKGRTIQSVFGLRANNYTITYDKASDSFIFNVRGRGHGVGLSQYGAYIMAKDGAGYKEILHHYYTNVELKRHNYK